MLSFESIGCYMGNAKWEMCLSMAGGILRIDDPFDRLPWDKPARVFRDIVGAMRHSYEVRIDVGDLARAGSGP